MTTAELIRPLEETRRAPAGVVLDHLISVEGVHSDLFTEVEPAERLVIPDYLHSGDKTLTVPSLRLISPRGHEARLVDIEQSHRKLHKLTQQAQTVDRKAAAIIDDKTLEMAARFLDTNGAEGLHHIHHTVFPNTVYHIAKRGNGIMMNVYLTLLGNLAGQDGRNVPVLGRIAATKDKKGEYEVFNVLGVIGQKAKRSV